MVIRDAAISATTDAQPSSPSLGDTYIVPAAPSGDDWAGQAKTVATFTARGWLFRQPFVGMMVYVEDEDAIYHYDSSGDWNAGLPIGAIPDGSIPPKKLTNPFAILKVEEVLNDPPGTAPTTGTMYQVGTSPTGDFATHTNEIARYDGSDYEFIAPGEGDTIYRKDQDTLYSYRSGAWVVTIPASAIVRSYYQDITNTSVQGASSTVNRTTFSGIQALVGQRVRLSYQITSASGNIIPGIRIDTTSSPEMENSSTANGYSGFVEIDVPDGSAHDYHLSTRTGGGAATSDCNGWAVLEIINPS